MIGTAAFCPKTGAQLSEKRYYDDHGRALRAPVEDAFVAGNDLDGELTTGAVRSSQRALLIHFRRTHQFYRPENADLYRNVALWLRRLKQSASGAQSPDMIVWLALSARVRREGYDAEWMLGHVNLRCPRCHGRLNYEQLGPDSIHAQCGTNCTDDNADRLSEIDDLAANLYAQTFEQEREDERQNRRGGSGTSRRLAPDVISTGPSSHSHDDESDTGGARATDARRGNPPAGSR